MTYDPKTGELADFRGRGVNQAVADLLLSLANGREAEDADTEASE